MSEMYDRRSCELGEGVVLAPRARRLFWFDIPSRQAPQPRRDAGVGMATAADGFGRRLDLGMGVDDLGRDRAAPLRPRDSETLVLVASIEADRPEMRSNDGRADRQGGFWTSTMGKAPADRDRNGAIYRWHKGELRQLFSGLTIPNAICFAPDGRTAYFADTPAHTIWRVALDDEGWPKGDRAVFLDLGAEGPQARRRGDRRRWQLVERPMGCGPRRLLCPRRPPAARGRDRRPEQLVPGLRRRQSFDTLFCTTALRGSGLERAARPGRIRARSSPNCGRGQGLAEPQVLL